MNDMTDAELGEPGQSTPEPPYGSDLFHALYDEYRTSKPSMSWEAWLAQRPPVLPAMPKFRSEISPGLAVVTDAAGCVVLETGRPRHTVTNVARLVIALETARDVAGGPPAQGSPMQTAITGIGEVADGLEHAVMAGVFDRPQPAGVALGAADELRQLAGDLQYGRLPETWMALPVAGAVPPCRVCHMRCRKTPQGPVALRHRPGCTGQEDS